MNKKMLRKKLALMLANLKKKRPFYTEVEYLESTGTQYIDTGYIASNTSGFKIGIMPLQASDRYFIGSRPRLTSDDRFLAGSIIGPQVYIGWNTNTFVNWTLNNVHTVQNNFMNSRTKVLDGTTIAQITSNLSSQDTRTVYLFSANDAAASLKDTCRIYKVQISEGSTLVRDFIPVLDWDMTPCMYDKVTDQLFYNAGTGNFTAGREIHYVEYLERPVDAGTGSGMWINTGLKYFADFEVGVSLRESVTNTCLGTSSAERLERNSAAYPQWKFTSAEEGAYASNISIIGYHELKWKDGKIYADGVQLATKAKTSTASTYPMVLFGIPTSATTANAYHNIIYFCKLWHPTDGTLVRDYLPAIDENGVGFMFDRVSHTIYDNAGTGAFKYPARELEYIESTGTQYIDLGFKVDNTYGFKVDYVYLNSNDRVVLGTKGSGDTRWCLSGSHNTSVNLSWNTSLGFPGLGLNKRQVAQMNYLNDRNRFLNGIGVTPITGTLASGAATYNVCLFGAFWGSSTASLFSAVRLYSTQISKGTELFRDFIPVFCNGSAGVLDKVNNVFYQNAGTGTFTTGKIVEPEYE